MPDLLELARNIPEANLRALALEGYVRLACDGERSKAPAQDRVAMLKPTLALATRAEEKRLVLARSGWSAASRSDGVGRTSLRRHDGSGRGGNRVSANRESVARIGTGPG